MALHLTQAQAQKIRELFSLHCLMPPGAPVNSCNSNKVYLDNIDTRVKSAISFNYEELYNEEDRLLECILGASFDGKNYQPLTAAISNTNNS